MRVISFVPSLTETLIEAGISVVGRTRFCIHPSAARAIPVVGGTKVGRWDKVQALKPDLVIFDREENTREMAESCGVPYVATHVTSVETLATELRKLSSTLSSPQLQGYAERAEALRQGSFKREGLYERLTTIPKSVDQVLYLIWRDPWMAVSADTFIGSVCEQVGLRLPRFDSKYPQIRLEDYSPERTLLLFSSEPFPFRKHVDEIKALGFPAGLVDGECFSWFGLRAIRFLESQRL